MGSGPGPGQEPTAQVSLDDAQLTDSADPEAGDDQAAGGAMPGPGQALSLTAPASGRDAAPVSGRGSPVPAVTGRDFMASGARISLSAPPFSGANIVLEGANASADPRIGTMLGKFRITRWLGKGGMGTVYLAEDTALRRSVAIKFLLESVITKPDVVERFLREAQVAAQLNHPNIIGIYDVAMDERGCYMVLELLHPESARSHLNTSPYPWTVATRIIADCCQGLKVAHEAGIIHRDIKPDNILFSMAGVVKLVDFGLVKLVGDEHNLTQTGVLCGTPLYMSPEQAKNQEMDVRSDLYSLGATYYALLTGKPPFMAPGVPQILLSHVTSPTPDPRRLSPDVPEACVQVVMKAMEKRRESRYQTAAEMGADLEAILAGVPHRNASVFVMEERAKADPLGLGGSMSGSGASSVLGRSTGAVSRLLGLRAGQTPASSRRVFLALGALGVLGVAGGAWVRTSLHRGPETKHTGDGPAKPAPTPAPLPPIKVGILHSLTGSLAVSERPLVDASELAIEELNVQGGLLGRTIEAVELDGKSEVTADSAFTRAAERLITKEKVAAVFGGYGSGGRKAIRPYFEQYDHLLFYPGQYEGLEESPNIVYTGSTPNQFVIPSLKWATEHLSVKRVFFVGTDGLRAHAISALIDDALVELGGDLVGKHFALVGESQFDSTVKRIKHAKPQLIINTLVGDSSVSFFRSLVEAGIAPSSMPVLSYTLGENELAQLGSMNLSGQYIARTRFPVSPGVQPDTFEQRFKKKYGEHRVVSDLMESAYYGVLLWAEAVRRAGSEDVVRVRAALREREYDIAGAHLRVDASNQHLWKVFQVGQINKQNRIQIIKTGDAPIPPIPFPAPRTRAEWQTFADALYQKWGNNWSNPQRPQAKRSKER